MNGLSLFTGSAIGEMLFRELIPEYRTVGYVENNPYCVAHIIKSIKDGLIDDAPIFDDVREFDRRPYQGMVDLISGGFPGSSQEYLGSMEHWKNEIKKLSQM